MKLILSLIVAGCPGNSAAKLCDNLILGGQNDWFLPSIDELYLMYNNLHLNNLGGFVKEERYWSSSEDSSNHLPFYTEFPDLSVSYGFSVGTTLRGSQFRVRAVRAY